MAVTFRGPKPARGGIGQAYRLQPVLRCGLLAARPGGRQRRRAPLAARATRWWRWGLQSQRGLRELSCGPGPSPPAAAGGVAGAGSVWEAGTSRGEQSPGLRATRCGQHAREVQVREDAAGERDGGKAAAVGLAGERLPPVHPALRRLCTSGRRLLEPGGPPLQAAEPGALGPEAVVSPQAEMDLEASRNGTARRLDGDFELGRLATQT